MYKIFIKNLQKYNMSYPSIKDKHFIKNLLKHKEYFELRIPITEDKNYNPSFLTDKILEEQHLILQSYQTFVHNFINPNTPYIRILIKHETGTGKTITSLSIAMEFIKLYQKLYYQDPDSPTPSIFIIGFSKSIFQRELLRHPEFGFITRNELIEYNRLKRLAESGTSIDQERLSEFESYVKKRLSKKGFGGFFKFIGYKQFFNQLFIFPERTTIEKVIYTEEQIIQGINDGTILVNQELVDQFANSLIICDEIHNVYNSVEKNNYGIAIQHILDIYENRPETLRAIFMTATPINNNPQEIIDLMNLLVPIKELGGHRLKKQNYFHDPRSLKSGALEKLEKLVKGRVSFLRDVNPEYFPKRILVGKKIKGIPYLKFIQCPMSEFHYKTYKEVYTGTLPPDGQALMDFILPAPSPSEINKKQQDDHGVFRTQEIKYELTNASLNWKDKVGINYIKQDNLFIITGEFMELKTLKKYSMKYHQMILDLIDLTNSNSGKIMIYHNYVQISGILFIQEVLKHNGFIDEYSIPTNNTRCAICGIIKKKHKTSKPTPQPMPNVQNKTHEYYPARFVIFYSDLDKRVREISREKFNNSNNIDGRYYKILLGSKIISEAEDFKAIQHMMIMNVPNNIPTLLQIFGRTVRKHSHANLPPENRHVLIKIYVSSLPPSNTDKIIGTKSYEEKRYSEKVKDYKIIQQIEKIFNINAVDAHINRNIIMPPETETKEAKSPPELGNLYFKPPPVKFPKSFKLESFKAFYSNQEVNTIMYIIKRLFIEQSHVWKYDDLWKATKNPPFKMEQNTSIFLEENFVLALKKLTHSDDAENIDTYFSLGSTIDKLFDPADREIKLANGAEYRIIKVSPFYILSPMIKTSKTTDFGINVNDAIGYPYLDFDSWYRSPIQPKNTQLDITKYLRKSNVSYENIKMKFIQRHKDLPIEKLSVDIGVYGINFHIQFLEDAIKYVFNFMTNKKQKISEFHDFYFKIIYFYDKLNVILFANHIEENQILKNIYAKYVDFSQSFTALKGIDKDPKKLNMFLMTTLSKTAGEYREFNLDRLNKFIGKIKRKAKKDIVPVAADILPIGHFLKTKDEPGISIPRLYVPEKEWFKSTEIVVKPPENAIENDIIIGYYESSAGLDIKFKIRPPIHKIVKYEDTRKIATGTVCHTKKKDELLNILKQLKLTPEANISKICNQIQLELMRRELRERRRYKKLSSEERKKNPRIIWMYLQFEQQLTHS